MSQSKLLAYQYRYGYSFPDALRAEFWWRVEHIGYYRGGDGGLCGILRSYGYAKRHAAERRGVANLERTDES